MSVLGSISLTSFRTLAVVAALALVVMILSGFPFAGCLHSAHPVLGAAFVILVAAHTVLSVPARTACVSPWRNSWNVPALSA